MMAAEQGQQIEPGLLLDEHGNPTTDASDFPDCAPGPISARGNGWNSLIGNGLSSSSTCMRSSLLS
jgi:LDH2 family malate/lactate/ureidoglycolate dehydrogenase